MKPTDDWTNNIGTELPEGFWEALPEPAGWKVLIMPQEPEKVSAGGIVLTESHQDAQHYNVNTGKIVAQGPIVGKRPPLNMTEWPYQVGDDVVFTKYQASAGGRINVLGVKLFFMNDEDILGKTANPEALRPKV